MPTQTVRSISRKSARATVNGNNDTAPRHQQALAGHVRARAASSAWIARFTVFSRARGMCPRSETGMASAHFTACTPGGQGDGGISDARKHRGPQRQPRLRAPFQRYSSTTLKTTARSRMTPMIVTIAFSV